MNVGEFFFFFYYLMLCPQKYQVKLYRVYVYQGVYIK